MFHLELIFLCIICEHFVLILDLIAAVFHFVKLAHDHFNSTNPLVLSTIDRHLFISVMDEVEVLEVVVVTVEHQEVFNLLKNLDFGSAMIRILRRLHLIVSVGKDGNQQV